MDNNTKEVIEMALAILAIIAGLFLFYRRSGD
jgi:hypothetical protein